MSTSWLDDQPEDGSLLTTLDSAFKRQPVPAEPATNPEPSFADLVSDTAMRATG